MKSSAPNREHADPPAALARILDELACVRSLHRLPEFGDTADVARSPVDDVMERDQPAGPDQGAVELEVAPHAVARVVTVDKEDVDRPSPYRVADSRCGSRRPKRKLGAPAMTFLPRRLSGATRRRLAQPPHQRRDQHRNDDDD